MPTAEILSPHHRRKLNSRYKEHVGTSICIDSWEVVYLESRGESLGTATKFVQFSSGVQTGQHTRMSFRSRTGGDAARTVLASAETCRYVCMAQSQWRTFRKESIKSFELNTSHRRDEIRGVPNFFPIYSDANYARSRGAR